MRKFVVFDGAPDCRCYRGKLVVGEVNYRHGPGYRLADDRCKVRYAVRGLNDQIRRRAARMAVPPAGRRRLRLNLERLIEASEWLSVNMGRELPGMVSRAGNFPGALGTGAIERPNSA